MFAISTGAPAQHTGAPGEQTCAMAGCHVGTAVNSSSGNVAITWSGGANYVPGQRGKFTVTITDTGGGRMAFGFQAVAKQASNNAQAGSWMPGSGMQVICQDDRLPPCRAEAALQYITHTSPSRAGTFEFDWTPPATDVGEIRVYVAGNAANGNSLNTGDRIYTASVALTPAAAQPNRPSISSGGVADAFNFRAGVAENSWVALFGANLSTETRTWDGSPELAQQRLPMTLGGVSVTIDGKPAPVYAISPGQVNVLTPVGVGTGNVPVVLRNANGETTATAVSLDLLPGIYAPFAEGNRLLVTAVENSTGAILGKRSVDARATRAFRPGDVVQFYANGLGDTNPPVGENQFIASPRPLVNTPQIRINDIPVDILGSALVGSGLFQVNARIPDLPDGDHPIVLSVNSASSPNNVYITIQR
jgi:uncharacterized protein (TIGR03437 family)